MPRKPTEPCTVTDWLWPFACSTLQAVEAQFWSSVPVISCSAQACPRTMNMPPRCMGPRMMCDPYILKKVVIRELNSDRIGAVSSICAALWLRRCLAPQIWFSCAAASGERRIRDASGSVMRYLASAFIRMWVRLWYCTLVLTPSDSSLPPAAPAMSRPALAPLDVPPPPPKGQWNSAVLDQLDVKLLARAAVKPKVSTYEHAAVAEAMLWELTSCSVQCGSTLRSEPSGPRTARNCLCTCHSSLVGMTPRMALPPETFSRSSPTLSSLPSMSTIVACVPRGSSIFIFFILMLFRSPMISLFLEFTRSWTSCASCFTALWVSCTSASA
mmetsp:Transcript_40859/g.116594  ORF Transcript_40859/g.116594 Transcript_40859/m.116594 type:complete len:328 (-) Transcript_40859:330-1313(-)